jgi:prepilin signal peptidase PulO-like enzyme (type II secretory pathway)
VAVSSVTLVVAAVVIGGVVVGPLLNHAITWWIGWRVVVPPLLGRVPPAGELGRARSRCASCDASLAPAGLPARPATALGGRCRVCGGRLPAWLAGVEATTAVLFGVAAGVVGLDVRLFPVLALIAGSIAMSAVDLAVMRIPTRFVHVTAAGVLAGLVLASVVEGEPGRFQGAAVGAAVLGGLLLVLHLASPRMLGFGDVRLAAVVGVATGWFGWTSDLPVLGALQAALDAGLLAGLIGTVAGLVLLVARGRNRPFPFGPAIAAGGLVVVLALA